MQDIDSYLQKMGVKDPGLRRRVEAGVPYADAAALGGGASGMAAQPVELVNAAAREASSSGSGAGTPVLVLCCDADGGLGGLEPLLTALELPVFAVCLPEAGEMAGAPADVAELAILALKAARGVAPAGCPLLLGGVGFGAVLAHELAIQLSASSPDTVQALALFEGLHTLRHPAALLSWLAPPKRREVCQAAAALYPVVAAAAGAAAPGIEAFAARLASIASYEEQLDYVASFKLAEVGLRVCIDPSPCGCLCGCFLAAGGAVPGSRQPSKLPMQLESLQGLNIQSSGTHPGPCRHALRRRARRPGTIASPPSWTAWPTGRLWQRATVLWTSMLAPPWCLPASEAPQGSSLSAAPPVCWLRVALEASGAALHSWCSLQRCMSCQRAAAQPR